MSSITEKFLAEADTDGDGKISAQEAAQLIMKIEKEFVSNAVYFIVQVVGTVVVWEFTCWLIKRSFF